MAVRLYPNTQDVAVLEDLCGVPAGTHDRLQELKSRELPDMGSRYANEQARYDLIHDDPECGCLDAFLTFGWGRANMLPEDAGYAGTEKDPHLVRMMMNSVGVGHLVERVIETGGVHWS